MTQFAQFVSEAEILFPDYSRPPFRGVPNVQYHELLHRINGWLPVVCELEVPGGYTARWTRFRVVEQSETVLRTTDRDPETGEQFIHEETDENGEVTSRTAEWREVSVQQDTSYIEVLDQELTAIPEPEPEPAPVVEYSKYKLKRKLESLGIWEQVKAAIEQAGYWESFLLIQTISSNNDELLAALPAIRQAFPEIDVDAVLAECVAE